MIEHKVVNIDQLIILYKLIPDSRFYTSTFRGLIHRFKGKIGNV